jgi:hypothetical protein
MKERLVAIALMGFRYLAAGLLLLLEGCIDDQGKTATPSAETAQPGQSLPVTPGQSQELRNLPTAPPPQTGTPVYEINPRVRPQTTITPAPPGAATPIQPSE